MSTANSVNSGLDCASPESIMDPTNLTPLGDQYSLGCVLYYCLSGRYPFPDGTAVEKMMCHQHKQPPKLKDLAPETPDEMVAVVERLMQKNPQDRFTDCKEVMEALRPLAAVATQPVRRTMSMPRVVLPRGANSPAAPPALPSALPPRTPVSGPAEVHSPRPLQRPAGLPSRPSSPGAAPAAPAPLARLSTPSRLQPPAPVAAAAVETEPEAFAESELEQAPVAPAQVAVPQTQEMGTTGVVMMAILAGVVAWLLSSLIKF